MTEALADKRSQSPQFNFLSCALRLLVVMALFTTVCGPVAYSTSEGLASLLAATVICTTAGVAALAVSYYCTLAEYHLPGILLAVTCRLLPPLCICLWLALLENSSDHDAFVVFLLVAYLVSLAAETYLSVKWIAPRGPEHKAA